MATKAETLTATPHVGLDRKALIARFSTAVREWGRKGQLGSSSSEMRSYTGAR